MRTNFFFPFSMISGPRKSSWNFWSGNFAGWRQFFSVKDNMLFKFLPESKHVRQLLAFFRRSFVFPGHYTDSVRCSILSAPRWSPCATWITHSRRLLGTASLFETNTKPMLTGNSPLKSLQFNRISLSFLMIIDTAQGPHLPPWSTWAVLMSVVSAIIG